MAVEQQIPITSGASAYISDSFGTRRLRHAVSYSISREGQVTAVQGADGRFVGLSDSPKGAGSLNLTTRRAKGRSEEVAWYELFRSGEDFRFEIQLKGGSRHVFFPCRVSTVGDEIGDDANVTRTVTMTFLDETEIGV